jgi:hypothetical protein
MLGGDPSVIQGDWRVLDDHLKSRGERRTNGQVAQELTDTLAPRNTDALFDKDIREALLPKLRVANGWDEAKEHGLDALRGGPLRAAQAIVDQLWHVGVAVCPFGELEAFHREAPGASHGAEWAAFVIENGLYKRLPAEKVGFIRSLAARAHDQPNVKL